MPTQEIKETNWQKFCERFDEAHRGTNISLEVVHHDGTTEALADNEPLRTFRFVRRAGCSDAIEIELGETTRTQHQIIDPIHMRLQDGDGSRNVLKIDAESGSVELRFSSGRIGAILSEMEMR